MVVKEGLSLDAKQPAGEKLDGTPYRVLIVDDSVFIAKQLGQILTSEGFEVLDTATNGAVGLEKFQARRDEIDFVTLDITMPVMDGVTALEKILEIDQTAKVVMVSALGKEDVVKKCLMMGAKGYIVKPLDRKKVLERISSIMNR